MRDHHMTATPIASLFQITPRYLRSTNLERDFHDPRALDNYVLTPHARECLERLSTGLRSGSTQRAWRITGNYGTGKSSFALFFAHWLSGQAARLSRTVEVDVKYDRFALGHRPAYLPLLITGAREPMSKAILRSLDRLLDEQYSRGAKSSLQNRIATLAQKESASDEEVVTLLLQANEKLQKDRKCSGLLLLLDELGKFLEFAAHHPQRQDVYLLQRLAEEASKPSRTGSLFIVGILHQGFDAYAENLDPTTQREWEKVAGRFEELIFRQPVLQLAELIAAALRVDTTRLPTYAKQEASAGWESAIDLGWMGAGAQRKSYTHLAAKLYPLHGTVVPAMVRAFTRFGQNERSLFSFLFSDEPRSLANHSRANVGPGRLYRLPQFYDYVRATFGYRLSLQSYRSHWAQIEAMVESFATSDPVQLDVVKTVGLLNHLDHPDLLPTSSAIEASLAGPGGYSAAEVRNAIEQLHKRRKVLFRRGTAGGYTLWPHTSVDLEAAYERAVQAVGSTVAVGSHLTEFLETRSLVARRHYIETGNLRHFGLRYLPVSRIKDVLTLTAPDDGIVLVVLCETTADMDAAEKLAKTREFEERRDILIAIPTEPLANHAGLLNELRRWDWVANNTPELNGDRFASEEVNRQRQYSRQRLEARVQDVVGLRSLSGAQALRWYAGGEAKKIANGRQLLEHLSDLCERMYSSAPKVKNELLNRHSLSSAAARARILLIGRILGRGHEPYLGMDSTKKPPEMSMYLSVLRRGRLHVQKGNRYRLQVPQGADDVLQFGPCLDAMRRYLEAQGDRRVTAAQLMSVLVRSPYGIRNGMAPLILALYAAMNSQELAFYEDDSFLLELSEEAFTRLIKNPASFQVQLCRITGVRAEVFESLSNVLGLPHSANATEPLVLDIVRPLCDFVAKLPEYVRYTQRLSKQALSIREVILQAKDPVHLLFRELPTACGFEPFAIDGDVALERARGFAKSLKGYLDELRLACDSLLQRMQERIRHEFDLNGQFAKIREELATRATSVALQAREPRLKAFCLRLIDRGLAESPWLESFGSLLASQPPLRWRDVNEDTYNRELHELVERFASVEAISFKGVKQPQTAEAFKIALTRGDGTAVQEVVFVDQARTAEVDELTRKIRALVGKNRSLGLAALSRATWAELAEE